MRMVIMNMVKLVIRQVQNEKLNHGIDMVLQAGMLFFDLKTVLLHK